MMPFTAQEIQGAGMTSPRTRERLVERLREQGIQNERVLDLMRRVPRHLFIEEALAHRAYEDTSLPIGFGQTISQPWVVARMTEALIEHGLDGGVCLEIGTGCGYQTAVLAELCTMVVSIERVEALQAKTRERLQRLGLSNCRLQLADGMLGWPKGAPYKAILAAAAPRQIPKALLDQLAVPGGLVIPVGGGETQELRLVLRSEQGFKEKSLGVVKFVPMLGGIQSRSGS